MKTTSNDAWCIFSEACWAPSTPRNRSQTAGSVVESRRAETQRSCKTGHTSPNRVNTKPGDSQSIGGVRRTSHTSDIQEKVVFQDWTRLTFSPVALKHHSWLPAACVPPSLPPHTLTSCFLHVILRINNVWGEFCVIWISVLCNNVHVSQITSLFTHWSSPEFLDRNRVDLLQYGTYWLELHSSDQNQGFFCCKFTHGLPDVTLMPNKPPLSLLHKHEHTVETAAHSRCRTGSSWLHVWDGFINY